MVRIASVKLELTTQELISRFDGRTLRAVNEFGLLHFSNNITLISCSD